MGQETAIAGHTGRNCKKASDMMADFRGRWCCVSVSVLSCWFGYVRANISMVEDEVVNRFWLTEVKPFFQHPDVLPAARTIAFSFPRKSFVGILKILNRCHVHFLRACPSRGDVVAGSPSGLAFFGARKYPAFQRRRRPITRSEERRVG